MKVETEKTVKENAVKEKLVKEKADKEKADKEKADKEKLVKEKADKEKKKRSIFREIMFSVVLLMLIQVVTLSVRCANLFDDFIVKSLEDSAVNISNCTSQILDAGVLTDIIENGMKSKNYLEVANSFQNICDYGNFGSLYIIIPDFDKNMAKVILKVRKTKNGHSTTFDQPFTIPISDEEHREIFTKVMAGKSSSEMCGRGKSIISRTTSTVAYAPLYGPEGDIVAIVCTESYENAYFQTFIKFARIMIFEILLVLCSFTIGLYRFLKRSVAIPITALTRESKRFSETRELVTEDILPKTKTENEMHQLANAITLMERQIVDDIDRIIKVTSENEKVATELGIASKLQQEIIPNKFPAFPERNDFDIYAFMNPHNEVGGDFYDYFLLDDNHLILVMGDVSGSGITAAMFMMHAKSTIKLVALSSHDPKEIISTSNRVLCDNNKLMLFVTVWLGIVTLDTGEVDMVNAGHEDIIVGNSEKGYEYQRVKHDGFLGIKKSLEYHMYSTKLEKGDNLIIYSDGIVESNDINGQMYGPERLKNVLNRIEKSDCKSTLCGVLSDVTEYSSGVSQFDDMTMLCFRRL